MMSTGLFLELNLQEVARNCGLEVASTPDLYLLSQKAPDLGYDMIAPFQQEDPRPQESLEEYFDRLSGCDLDLRDKHQFLTKYFPQHPFPAVRSRGMTEEFGIPSHHHVILALRKAPVDTTLWCGKGCRSLPLVTFDHEITFPSPIPYTSLSTIHLIPRDPEGRNLRLECEFLYLDQPLCLAVALAPHGAFSFTFDGMLTYINDGQYSMEPLENELGE